MSGRAAEWGLGLELLQHSKEVSDDAFNTLGYTLACTGIILASLKKTPMPEPLHPQRFSLNWSGLGLTMAVFSDCNMPPRVYPSWFQIIII